MRPDNTSTDPPPERESRALGGTTRTPATRWVEILVVAGQLVAVVVELLRSVS
jgi:hypothetical protein